MSRQTNLLPALLLAARVDHDEVANPPGGDGCDIGAVEFGSNADVDPTIFADGFEDGHTLRWTSEVP